MLPRHNDPRDMPVKQGTQFERTIQNLSPSSLVNSTPRTNLNDPILFLSNFPPSLALPYTAERY